MPELQYKFKSSLSFETVKFSESTISVGVLKNIINQKQSIKTNGFDLKLKDSEGKVYNDDDEIVDIKHRIIVSRIPKVAKPTVNVRKKDFAIVNKVTDVAQRTNDAVTMDKKTNVVTKAEPLASAESSQVLSPTETTTIAITPDNFKCSLCKKTMKDATRINCCQKNFCYECITGYLFDPDISGSMECPECKSTVSNCEANLTENLKIRELIKSHTIGDAEMATQDDNDVAMSITDIKDEQTEPITISPKASKDNEMCVSLTDLDNLHMHTNDILLPEHHPMNEISVEHEFPRLTELPESQDKVELPAIAPINVPDIKILKVNDSNNYLITHDHNYKIPMDKESSSHKRSRRGDQNQTEAKVSSVAKNSVNQSIEELEFDPVLYMKFLKIVGEKYPDDLRKILSNNIEMSHSSKESKTSSNTRHRSREDDSLRDKVPKKKSRRDHDSEIVQPQKSYVHSEKQTEKHHEEEERRNRDKEGVKKSNGGAPGNKRYKSRSRSREVVMRPQSREVVMRPHSREVVMRPHSREVDQRPKDYYSQAAPRYPRQQEVQPPYSDLRRRLQADFSGRDKQKYGRRSDR